VFDESSIPDGSAEQWTAGLIYEYARIDVRTNVAKFYYPGACIRAHNETLDSASEMVYGDGGNMDSKERRADTVMGGACNSIM
jgi:hypothetical protein